MFNFIKNSLKKIYSGFTSRIAALFGKSSIDEETLKELEKILLSADTGVTTTSLIITELKKQHAQGKIPQGQALKTQLREILLTILSRTSQPSYEENIFVLVGINGSGKTTCAGKLAHHFASLNKKVLLVAADTFRAAAPEQLQAWADITNVDIVRGTPDQDPASVVFVGCQKFIADAYDILIIDTAGRLHTKINLMNELAKIKRVITKALPDNPIATLLTIDSMLGQNSFEQAKTFKECTDVTGIILTKMDSTAKGGIVFSIANTLAIPIAYVTFGEKIDQIKQFDKEAYVDNVLTL